MAGVVIVGGGQAGASVAEGLRKGGYGEPVTLIGAEPVLPYQRPPLSKAYLLGEMPLDRLCLRPARWYAEKDIALKTGVAVTSINRTAKTVTAGEEDLPYDHLVLATGAAPIRLPAIAGGDLAGVHTMRDLADADTLAPLMTEGRRLLVVGGGYIGLEAAAVARKRGMEVVLVEAAQRILGRVAAPETADWFRALHRRHGVDVREGVGLEHLTGTTRVTGGHLTDETEIAADLVIVGIGIRPRTDLAEAAGLTIDNGIAVDARCRTSDPAIWAAGDCAAFLWDGARIRLESVGNAIDQGMAVAANILGADAEYHPTPWFWSDQYEVKLQIAGLNTGYGQVVVRPGATADCGSHWYYRRDRLIAIDAMSDPRAYMVGKRLIEAGKSPDPLAIADPDTDLKALLRP